MPTPTKGKRLGGSPAHERAILSNLATNLFEHGRITTTETKARRLRPFAERLITKARRGDLHARRQVMRVIRDKDVVHVLFTEIGPRFATRPGGYTRITKVGPRPGDNAPMAVIELVEELAEGAGTQQRSPQGAAAAAPAAPEAAEATTTEDTTADEAAAAEDVGSAVETAAVEESADVEAATADDGAAAAETLTGEESADDEVEAEGAAEGTETENTDEDSTKS